MAKFLLKIKARELRNKKGMSIKTIAQFLSISKSTVSLWCRDIELTPEQTDKLLNNMKEGMKRGQIIAALRNKKQRLDKIDKYNKEGVGRFKKLSKEGFFTAGLMLYLAEGYKKSNRIRFTNSDPEVIKFMLLWFKEFFEVSADKLRLAIHINIIHKKREKKVKKFWSGYLNIPLESFNGIYFVKTKQQKVYENYDNYFGTLTFMVLKSSELLYKILGLINGLLESKLRQGSSVVRAGAS